MLFYLFCMFDDYGGTSHRNPESAGKSVITTPYSQSSISKNDHRQVPIILDDRGAKRGDPGGARGAHTTWWCGWTPRRASRVCGCPGPPGATPFRVLHPPITLRHNTSSTESSAASTGWKLAREKSSPAGSNLPRKFLPRGGRSKPSSLSSNWTSLGSSSPSSPSPSPPLHSVPL